MRQTTVLMPHLCTLVWWPRTWPQAFVGRIQHSKDEHIQPDFSFRKDVAVLVSSVSPLRWPSACMTGSLFAPWRVRLSCLTAPALASHSCFQCVARVKQFRQIKKEIYSSIWVLVWAEKWWVAVGILSLSTSGTWWIPDQINKRLWI